MIPLPPLPEQHRIVEKVDQLMARCDELEKLRKAQEQKRLDVHAAAVRQLLDTSQTNDHKQAWQFLQTHFGELYMIKENVAELRKAILQLAVMGKLIPQDPNDPPASELLKEIEFEKARLIKEKKIKKTKPLPPIEVNEVPYELPKGWKWVRLGRLGFTQTGTTPKKGDDQSFGNDFPFIKPADILKNGVVYDNEGLSESGVEKYGRLAPAGSSLMVCIGTIGKTNIITQNCSFNQQINSLTPYVAESANFIQIGMRSSYFQKECWDRSSSTTIAILNKGKWELIPHPLPPLAEQQRIVEKVDQLMALCDTLEKQIDAASLRQTQLLTAVMAQVS